MRGWAAAQDKLAQLSTNSTHRTVAGASHAALLEDKSFARAQATRSPRSFVASGQIGDDDDAAAIIQTTRGGSVGFGWLHLVRLVL